MEYRIHTVFRPGFENPILKFAAKNGNALNWLGRNSFGSRFITYDAWAFESFLSLTRDVFKNLMII